MGFMLLRADGLRAAGAEGAKLAELAEEDELEIGLEKLADPAAEPKLSIELSVGSK